jgi:hypothetical protein
MQILWRLGFSQEEKHIPGLWFGRHRCAKLCLQIQGADTALRSSAAPPASVKSFL